MLNNGMFYVVNDPQYIKPKSVGVGTTGSPIRI